MGNQYPIDTDDRVIPVAEFFTNPDRAVPKLSPDGKWLSYLAPAANHAKNLQVFIQPLEQFRQGTQDGIQQITHHGTHDIRTYKWTLDSSSVLFLQDKDGNKDFHLYHVDVQTGVERQFTPFEGVSVGILSVNRTWFVEHPSRPNTGVIALNKQDRRRFDLYHVDLQTGALTLHTTLPQGYEEAVLDMDLQVRAIAKIQVDGSTAIEVHDAGEGVPVWSTIVQGTPLDEIRLLAWTQDNHLLVKSSVGREVVAIVDLDPLTMAETVLLQGNVDVTKVKMHPWTKRAQLGCCNTGRDEWTASDHTLQAHLDRINKYLKDRDADLKFIPYESQNDSVWALQVECGDKPSTYVLYHLDPSVTRPPGEASGEPDSHFEDLFSANAKVAAYKLGRMASINYKARDGLDLQAYLTYPPSFDSRSTYPLVLLPHGGPWTRNYYGYSAWTQWLASRNYVVLQPNCRGSTGFTETVLSSGFKQFGKAMQTDLLDAVEHVTNVLKIVDREHVALFGGSYGGYCAVAGVTLAPEDFPCAADIVDIVGMSNLKSFLARTPAYWHSFLSTFYTSMGHPEHDLDLLDDVSPLIMWTRLFARS